MHRVQELVRLHRLGVGARERARLLKMGPNTERRLRETLSTHGLLEGPEDALPDVSELRKIFEANHKSASTPPQEQSSVEDWIDPIQAGLDDGMGPRAIYDRLRLRDDGFTGSYDAVKRICRRLRKAQPPKPEDVVIPVETVPGDVAQVDFGYVGKLLCPQTHVLRKAWVFVMTLGYSRHMFARVVFNQKTETWLQLFVEAFRVLGGAPKTIVPDNLKAAVIRAAFQIDTPAALNRSFRELARHYGCKVDPTPPMAPKKKGKVESNVRYLKNNFFVGRSGDDVDHVNRDLDQWLHEIAGKRIHGTTGRRPLATFCEEEKRCLRALPQVPFETVIWKEATVHRDAHIVFEYHLYSVPWALMTKKVWVRATRTSVIIFHEDIRVATHVRRYSSGRSTEEHHLPEGRRELRHRSRDYWTERAERIGEETKSLIEDLFDSDDVLSQLRPAQAIVTHLETFPKERAERAARRARFFGNLNYGSIKRILSNGLDFEPLPVPVVSASSTMSFSFARDLDALGSFAMENHNEPN